jgi:hypothetical protein
MKIFSGSVALLSAGMLALAGVAKAQLETYETVTGWEGSGFTFSASGSNATRGQVFANVSAVKSMTYNFFTSGVAAATNLTAVFGEWNGTSLVVGTTVSFGTITIPSSNSGLWLPLGTTYGTENGTSTFAQTFNLGAISSPLTNSTFGYLTDSSKSYALMLTNTTGVNTNLALGLTNDDVFAYGYARGFTENDWAFSQIVVAPGNQILVPIPESSTVAAIGSAVLVMSLASCRMRQRRPVSQAPAAADSVS